MPAAEPSAGSLRRAEEITGHRFADPALVARALTHPSAVEGASIREDYERLEFLGDAVLGLVVVDELYRRYPELTEGEMTKLKVSVVSGGVLSEVAASLGLEELIVLGGSERGAGSRGRRSALENVYEALVGALYADGGLEAARSFVLASLGRRIEPSALAEIALDHPKSALQELLQARGETPTYRIVAEEGPPHRRTFHAEALLGDRVVGAGAGASKKEAELNAAREALALLSAPSKRS